VQSGRGQANPEPDDENCRSESQREAAAREVFLAEVVLEARRRAVGFFDIRRLRSPAFGAAAREEVATLGRPRRGARVSFSRARRCSVHRSFTKFFAPTRIVMLDSAGLPH
jgi:hypothetical protein